MTTITHEAAQVEARYLELKYGKVFLEKSLHDAALRWRLLTSPNAKEMIDLRMIPVAPTSPSMAESIDARLDASYANGVRACLKRLAHLRRPEDEAAWKDCEAMYENRRAEIRASTVRQGNRA